MLDANENKGNQSRRLSKPIIFPNSYYTVDRTITSTTTLEVNYHRRKPAMSSTTTYSEGITALMLACVQNRVDDVKSILKKNVSVSYDLIVWTEINEWVNFLY